ncbi:MAG TPA: HD domain-containing phosphohydrolase [Aurantimonas sp.]|uniref:HD domain-containing protein n=1 Tax=Aurantimonas marianensis TaxID=2920428 RepID=A0A9X2HAV2_9HYPH|nr:HD domain-containing protein [Aurantimonas marianensis]MCP3055022.1 HD domain-containing protein [Aurantimonas marianensis]
MDVAIQSNGDRLSKAELVSALSYALDLTEGQPEGHSVRCCWIGMNVGRELGLSDGEMSDLYYTLLLKDIGCSSNAARICQLFLTDDIAFKRDIKIVDDSLPQMLRFVLKHTGLKANLAERFRTMVIALAQGEKVGRELIETRCHRGADIVRQMRFSEAVAGGILDLDEHWDGNGQPQRLSGTAISLFGRIALLAQVVDVFRTSADANFAVREVEKRSGRWFDPELVAAFGKVAVRKNFWSTLASPEIEPIVISLAPGNDAEAIDEDFLDNIAEAFAQVVDSKSPFTHGHSERVALFTDLIAVELGFDAEHRRYLKRVALLHDIGKLGVSNQVLDKPGKLDDAEWAAVKRHPAFSEEILARVSVFQDLARIAGAHHERLDGKGYPRGLKGDAICFDTRILTTADIFDAMTADRPYRKAMPVSKALDIMREGVGTATDARCFQALEAVVANFDAVLAPHRD